MKKLFFLIFFLSLISLALAFTKDFGINQELNVVDWEDIGNIPSGFDDGVDNINGTSSASDIYVNESGDTMTGVLVVDAGGLYDIAGGTDTNDMLVIRANTEDGKPYIAIYGNGDGMNFNVDAGEDIIFVDDDTQFAKWNTDGSSLGSNLTINSPNYIIGDGSKLTNLPNSGSIGFIMFDSGSDETNADDLWMGRSNLETVQVDGTVLIPIAVNFTGMKCYIEGTDDDSVAVFTIADDLAKFPTLNCTTPAGANNCTADFTGIASTEFSVSVPEYITVHVEEEVTSIAGHSTCAIEYEVL